MRKIYKTGRGTTRKPESVLDPEPEQPDNLSQFWTRTQKGQIIWVSSRTKTGTSRNMDPLQQWETKPIRWSWVTTEEEDKQTKRERHNRGRRMRTIQEWGHKRGGREFTEERHHRRERVTTEETETSQGESVFKNKCSKRNWLGVKLWTFNANNWILNFFRRYLG